MTNNDTSLKPVSIAHLLDSDHWLGYTAVSISQHDICVSANVDWEASGNRTRQLYELVIASSKPGQALDLISHQKGMTKGQVIETLQAYKPYKI